MTEVTTTVKMDEQGRCYIPKVAREKLGIAEGEATVELTVRYDGDED